MRMLLFLAQLTQQASSEESYTKHRINNRLIYHHTNELGSPNAGALRMGYHPWSLSLRIFLSSLGEPRGNPRCQMCLEEYR
jgi:hypothetical protein